MKPTWLLLAIGMLSTAWLWGYRSGRHREADRDAAVIQRMADERDTAWTSLQTMNEAALREAREAAARQAHADQMIASLTDKQKQSETQASTWRKQFEQAAKSKECAVVLEQTVCASVFKD